MPTIALNPLTLSSTIIAPPPAIGAGAGNGNDVNVPATVAGRSRALAPLVMTRNVPDNGAISATIVLTARTILTLGGHSVPSISATITGVARANAPIITPSIALTIGQTLLIRPANVLVLGMANTVGAGATLTGSAGISLVVPVAPTLSVEVFASIPSALVYALGVAQTLTLAQSPNPITAIALALGMSGFVDTGSTSNQANRAPSSHDVIRANPRGGAAKAKREV